MDNFFFKRFICHLSMRKPIVLLEQQYFAWDLDFEQKFNELRWDLVNLFLDSSICTFISYSILNIVLLPYHQQFDYGCN